MNKLTIFEEIIQVEECKKDKNVKQVPPIMLIELNTSEGVFYYPFDFEPKKDPNDKIIS